ncbi:MAG: hypothetical protein AAGD06_28300 [Acidobacteriota bacterium]
MRKLRFPTAPGSPASSIHARLKALVGGDEGAAEWLYDLTADDLHRRLERRYGGSPGFDAADLLQDAYVFYFQNDFKVLRDFLARVPDDGRAEQALRRHLWDLACGLVANRRRSGWQRRAVTVPEVLGPSSDLVDAPAVARDALAKLDRCLAGRSHRAYLYFLLRFVDGLKPRQISEATGWPIAATYKAREAFDRALAACAELLGLRRAEGDRT